MNELKHIPACSSQIITICPQKSENREISDYSYNRISGDEQIFRLSLQLFVNCQETQRTHTTG